jgi:hypothetical protein
VSSPTEPAARLGDALTARGLRVRVDAAGTLAILVPLPRADAPLDWSAERHEIVRLARLHGFSHVAVELPGDDGAGD